MLHCIISILLECHSLEDLTIGTMYNTNIISYYNYYAHMYIAF